MSDSPYELQRLVTVETFNLPWEAQIAQARLAAAGIHSIIANEHLIRMMALANAVGGIQVQVREVDHAAAVELLRRRTPLPEIYLVTSAGGEGEHGEDVPGSGGRAAAESGGTELDGAEPKRVELDAAAEARRAAHDNAALAVVARFHTPWEAHLARTLLESEGIASCVFEERLPAVSLLSATTLPHNRLEVRQEDAARAAAIMARAWSSEGLPELPEPEEAAGAD